MCSDGVCVCTDPPVCVCVCVQLSVAQKRLLNKQEEVAPERTWFQTPQDRKKERSEWRASSLVQPHVMRDIICNV